MQVLNMQLQSYSIESEFSDRLWPSLGQTEQYHILFGGGDESKVCGMLLNFQFIYKCFHFVKLKYTILSTLVFSLKP